MPGNQAQPCHFHIVKQRAIFIYGVGERTHACSFHDAKFSGERVVEGNSEGILLSYAIVFVSATITEVLLPLHHEGFHP
jgi:hypothetical protein